MRMITRFGPAVTVGVLSLGILGCKGGDSAGQPSAKKKPELASAILKPGDELAYFPMAEGSEWKFDSITTRSVEGQPDAQRGMEITYRIIKLTTEPDGGKVATFSVLDNGIEGNKETWRIDKTGIYQVGVGAKEALPIVPPQMSLPFPVKAQQSFSWKGIITGDKGDKRTGDIQSTVVGEEPVDTGLGTMNAVSVESSGKIITKDSPVQLRTKTWYVPKVGIGRMRTELAGTSTGKDRNGRTLTLRFKVVQVMKLKSTSLKG